MVLEIGLERLGQASLRRKLERARLGLLVNQASVDRELEFAADVLLREYPGQLKCLFSPQHGIWGEQQANMLETSHCNYGTNNLPVYSLYSETRRPEAYMLDKIDALVIDLQDVGTRVYTFIWTMLEVLRACAAADKSVIILDRPNPIGGDVFEGPPLEPGFESFVGGATIPMRHGLTMGELAQLLRAEQSIDVDLTVVPMVGWRRSDYFSDNGRAWMWPSPNMPTTRTAELYPGQVLLEGVNLSEGRGTTRPFELIGAPFVDAVAWIEAVQGIEFPGLRLLPTRFQPTFDKWHRSSCQGIDIQITNSAAVRSFTLTVALIATAAKLFPEFAWLEPPYEYEFHKPPIDILFGSSHLRTEVNRYVRGETSLEELLKQTEWDQSAWKQRIEPHLLYNV